MQVGADRIGRESLLHCPYRYGPHKTAATVAQIKQHSTFSRLKHIGLYFPGKTIDDFQLAIVIDVSMQVARSHDPQQFLSAGPAAIGEDLVIDDHWGV